MTASVSDRLHKFAEEVAALEHDRADGWIEWRGGTCPVAGPVVLKFRDGRTMDATGGTWFNWAHYGTDCPGDIVAYRPVAPNDAERPKSWALLCDTLKRQKAEIDSQRAQLAAQQEAITKLRNALASERHTNEVLINGDETLRIKPLGVRVDTGTGFAYTTPRR